MVFAGIQSGIGIADDMNTGMIDRFRSLPVARSGFLLGRTVSDGIRLSLQAHDGHDHRVRHRLPHPQRGRIGAVAMVIVAIMFGIALVTFSEYMGLAIKDPETVQAAVFIPLLPLIFTSSAFAPVSRLPGWMQPIARVNPVTSAIDTARGLVLGDDTLYKVSQVHLADAAIRVRDRLGGDHGLVHLPRRAPVSEGLIQLQSARSRVVDRPHRGRGRGPRGGVVRAVAGHGAHRVGRRRAHRCSSGSGPTSGASTPARPASGRCSRTTPAPAPSSCSSAAGVVSLVGVGFAFLKAKEHPGYREVLLEALGIVTIALSWLVVHTTFALRYAHLYYTEPVGGIDFKQGPDYRPDYRDFAYTAFTVGMTYQVSDTDITKRELRHTVLRHALLSFVFGAVIIGATVNIVAGLLNT